MSGYVNVGAIIADKYRVERVLGVGGMGMVVAATHLDLGQQVAIKVMLPYALGNANAVARFLHEAQAVARLRSEHVCRVFDLGTYDGAPFIVMEMLAGQDLAQILERNGALPLNDVVDCLIQVLDALADAHARGIVHRDLKPSNVFVTTASDGSALVKLLDFGVSKSSTGSTRTGEMMGTPAYMAPEQMQSTRDVDPRADLWALGVIGYEAMTGRNPFDAETLPGMCIRVMTHEPPALPGAFGAVVMRCLAKAPEARFANAAELAEALAPFGSPAASQLAQKIVRASGVRMAIGAPTTLQGAAAMRPGTQMTISARARSWLPAVAVGAGLAVAIGAAIPRHTESAAIAGEAPVSVRSEKSEVQAPARAGVAAPAPVVAPAPVAAPPPAAPVVTAPARVPRIATAKQAAPAVVFDPSLPDTLTRELIDPAIATTKPLTIECAHDVDDHGVVTLHVRVERNGRISSVTIDSQHPELARCVAATVKQLTFTRTNNVSTFQRTFVL